jgi:hypothetical protein
MAWILPILFAIAVIAIAPARVSIIFCALVVLVPMLVSALAKKVADAEVTFVAAAKAVALSLVLVFVLGLMLLTSAQGSLTIGPGLLVLFLLAYTLGFKLVLGTSFRASAIIGLAAAVASGALAWIVGAAIPA